MLICTTTNHNNGFVRLLPEEIIIDILSRLPADCVLKCRRVCKEWLALTSTPYFTKMHLKRAAPVIFVQSLQFGNLERDELDLFIFDKGDKEDKMMKKMRAGSMHIGVERMPILSGSCNGLLLFKPMFPTNFALCFICNPVTWEQMTVRPPVCGGMLCGFFFHPLVKAIELLFMHPEGIGFQYFLYSLGDKKGRKTVAFPYWPTYSVNPVIVNGALHWMIKHDYKSAEISHCKNVIMMFNMDTGFCTLPHPGKQCCMPRRHEMMQLIEKDGQLCFSCICDRSLVIWVLGDYENWFWVKKYKVDLRYLFVLIHVIPDFYTTKMTLLNIQNDELLLDWRCIGLFRYHLGRNTVRKVGGARTKLPHMLLDLCITTSYIKIFVSLKRHLNKFCN
ncbi:F-box protein like [Actinidia chinensis var. chinensis]|uniref:F-box protein like n=1 Tax=Actinidia chinensis var. chinensis TaxID=1590841 RepID=A0A2R6RFV0_ACTCC|nr:F-box protein like [Actinidia chinensis var. chinensis]